MMSTAVETLRKLGPKRMASIPKPAIRSQTPRPPMPMGKGWQGDGSKGLDFSSCWLQIFSYLGIRKPTALSVLPPN